MKTFIKFRRIYLYILNEFLLSFMVAFLFFFFIFFVNQLLVMAEEIFSKKVPFGDVLLFIVYSLPSILALAFPFGSLVGALMAVGRLSSDNEVLALSASGVPLAKIFLPLVLVGVILSSVSFVMNDYFLPLGNLRLGRMYRKIIYTNPAIELEPYSVKRYEDTVIITGSVIGNRIEDIVIIDKDSKSQKRVIKAKRAYLVQNERQAGVISLRLEDVFSHIPASEEQDQFEYTVSDSMIYNILLKSIDIAFINPGPREMSSVDVWREIQTMKDKLMDRRRDQKKKTGRSLYNLEMELSYALDLIRYRGIESVHRAEELASAFRTYLREKEKVIKDRNFRLYRLEYNKKYSIPASCLFFVFFAFPVGLLAKRSGRSVGFGIGLLMSALYWGLLFTGHSLGIRLELSPFLSMWMPNIVVLLLGSVFFVIRL